MARPRVHHIVGSADAEGLIAPLLPNLATVRIVNRTLPRAQQLVDQLRNQSGLASIGLSALASADADDATDDAHVVCLCVLTATLR